MGYRVLGQVAPAANADTTLLTANTETVISTLTICNRSTNAASFRVAVRPGGVAIAPEHYVAHGVQISGNDLVALTLGLTLGEGDVVTVRSDVADLTFHAYGQEV